VNKKYVNSKTHSVVKDDDVQIVGEALESIKEKHGILKSEDIVKTAKPKSNPLHKYFDWDDAHAAELYRRQEATRLVQSINIIILSDGAEEEVRAFVNITQAGTDAGRGYESALEIREEHSAEAAERAINELRQWLFRWLGVPELASLSRMIEKGIQITEKKLSTTKKEEVNDAANSSHASETAVA
jgi:hypothetical protein